MTIKQPRSETYIIDSCQNLQYDKLRKNTEASFLVVPLVKLLGALFGFNIFNSYYRYFLYKYPFGFRSYVFGSNAADERLLLGNMISCICNINESGMFVLRKILNKLEVLLNLFALFFTVLLMDTVKVL